MAAQAQSGTASSLAHPASFFFASSFVFSVRLTLSFPRTAEKELEGNEAQPPAAE